MPAPLEVVVFERYPDLGQRGDETQRLRGRHHFVLTGGPHEGGRGLPGHRRDAVHTGRGAQDLLVTVHPVDAERPVADHERVGSRTVTQQVTPTGGLVLGAFGCQQIVAVPVGAQQCGDVPARRESQEVHLPWIDTQLAGMGAYPPHSLCRVDSGVGIGGVFPQ